MSVLMLAALARLTPIDPDAIALAPPAEVRIAAGQMLFDEHGCTTSSKSQFDEELTLLPLLLQRNGTGNGTFVELGAFDGMEAANTLVLEKCFGWRGLLIEANPSNFARLAKAPRTATAAFG